MSLRDWVISCSTSSIPSSVSEELLVLFEAIYSRKYIRSREGCSYVTNVRILVLVITSLRDPYNCNKTIRGKSLHIYFETLNELVLADTNPTQPYYLPVAWFGLNVYLVIVKN